MEILGICLDVSAKLTVIGSVVALGISSWNGLEFVPLHENAVVRAIDNTELTIIYSHAEQGSTCVSSDNGEYLLGSYSQGKLY